MKTVRRDWLKKQVLADKMDCRNSLSFDDQFGQTVGGEWKPARISVGGRGIEGYFNMLSFDFESRSGSAHRNPDGTISLRVHSNHSVTLRPRA